MGRKPKTEPDADKLIDNIAVTLTEDQLYYLKHHKDEKRTKLAKKLGIPKLNLNHLLYRL